QLLHLALRPGGDGDLEGAENAEDARRGPVEVVSHTELELFDVDGRVDLGNTDQFGESADGFRAVAAAAHPGDRRHPWIVPAADRTVLHQREQVAFAHDRVI